MQPVWHDCILIHQVSDAFQHRLEIVLLHRVVTQCQDKHKKTAGFGQPMRQIT